MPTPVLTKGAASIIDKKLDDLFDGLKIRLLGPSAAGRRLFIGFVKELSLPGLFAAACTEEGGKVDTAIIEQLSSITNDFIDKYKQDAKANIKKRIQDILTDVDNGNVTSRGFRKKLLDALDEVMTKVAQDVNRAVVTETQHAVTMGTKEGLDQVNADFGVTDPVVCFIPVRDHLLCKECRRLHLMPNGRTPRVWKSSEVKAGYHKVGDPEPSWSLLHPHCRCALATILPGFGFDASGSIIWKREGWDEWAHQRGMQKGEAPLEELIKSTREGLKIWKMLKAAYEENDKRPMNPPNPVQDAAQWHSWQERRTERFVDRWMLYNRHNKQLLQEYGDAIDSKTGTKKRPTTLAEKAAGKGDWAYDSIPVDFKPWYDFLRKHIPEAEVEEFKPEFMTPQQSLYDAVDSAPITMNFPASVIEHLMEDGRFANLYETGEGMGENDPDIRRNMEHENLSIDPDIDETERPVYGALHFMHTHPRFKHQGGAPAYGSSWVQLKPDVKKRTSFTVGDSFNGDDPHTVNGLRRVIDRYVRQGPWSSGHRVLEMFRTGRDHKPDQMPEYIEAQIHGGVYMPTDVESLHFIDSSDGKYLGNPDKTHHYRQKFVEAGRQYGIPVYEHAPLPKKRRAGSQIAEGENAYEPQEYEQKLLYSPELPNAKPKKTRKKK